VTAFDHGAAAKHLATLAARHRIKMTYRNSGWQAIPSTRQAWVPDPTTAKRYLAALHELGHIASSTARRRGNQDYPALGVEVLVEGAAWAWATAVADPALLADVPRKEWAEVFAYMGSYLKYACMQSPPATMPSI